MKPRNYICVIRDPDHRLVANCRLSVAQRGSITYQPTPFNPNSYTFLYNSSTSTMLLLSDNWQNYLTGLT